MEQYSKADKLFHKLALNYRFIRATSFDIDCSLTPNVDEPSLSQRHVFVSGLARAGTSVLLQALYHTQSFATLTYRNMPFVLAPGLWGKVSRKHEKKGELAERAHGDGLEVSFDSPEAFEEVFWLTFSEPAYRTAKCLNSEHITPISSEAIKHFKQYIANVQQSEYTKRTSRDSSNSLRYLSKNNNNLLRLNTLAKSFPESLIIIPFRTPIQHAISLFKQHQKFTQTHAADPYSLDYMNWLGHHEFGANHLPIQITNDDTWKQNYSPDSLNYWVAYWIHIHQSILNSLPHNAVMFHYDAFCQTPQAMFELLADKIDVNRQDLMKFSSKIKPSNKYNETEVSVDLAEQAMELYRTLSQLSLGS